MSRKTTEQSRPLAGEPLIDQIDEILEGNGSITADTKDRLMFSVVKALIISSDEIRDSVNEIKDANRQLEKRVETLEKRNIVTWCIDHPALATVLISLMAILIVSHYGDTVLSALGIKFP